MGQTTMALFTRVEPGEPHETPWVVPMMLKPMCYMRRVSTTWYGTTTCQYNACSTMHSVQAVQAAQASQCMRYNACSAMHAVQAVQAAHPSRTPALLPYVTAGVVPHKQYTPPFRPSPHTNHPFSVFTCMYQSCRHFPHPLSPQRAVRFLNHQDTPLTVDHNGPHTHLHLPKWGQRSIAGRWQPLRHHDIIL